MNEEKMWAWRDLNPPQPQSKSPGINQKQILTPFDPKPTGGHLKPKEEAFYMKDLASSVTYIEIDDNGIIRRIGGTITTPHRIRELDNLCFEQILKDLGIDKVC